MYKVSDEAMNRLKKFIEHKAYNMRINTLIMTAHAQSGHPTSALSAADIIAALFFDTMRFDLKNPENPHNDRFILSKGHASPIFYAVYKELGILSQEELLGYRTFNSVLEGHPTARFAYTEAATGSLGIGLSVGAGMALSAKKDGYSFYTYVLMGDGEIAEGSIWEAAELAHYYKLDNLVGIVDCNRLGQSTEGLHGHHIKRYAEKFEAFGWKSIVIDGHDVQQIISALHKARDPNGHPTVIIAKTVKGYGVQHVEDKMDFHGKPFDTKEMNSILEELEKKFPAAAKFASETYEWHPIIPKGEGADSVQPVLEGDIPIPRYELGEKIATRQAYGQALTALGTFCKRAVSLDADVKNSTFAQLFEEKFPERFIQCFIAEQNMIGMGVGFSKRGYMPFISTFAAFFSRCYDQVRMAAVGTVPLRLVGSHAGVSIGKDGPSQMGLEDIALMRALPGSCVLYPSDAVSAWQLVMQMAEYNQGISYLRTTRMATPVLYDSAEQFPIGGCKLLKSSDKDVACIIGAGITVHEALKAYEQLKSDGVFVAVIDLYSIKPLDHVTIEKIANRSSKRIITVEDHYLHGGLGEAVTYALRNSDIKVDCLAVTQLPRSGTPEELLAFAGIDAQAIMQKIQKV